MLYIKKEHYLTISAKKIYKHLEMIKNIFFMISEKKSNTLEAELDTLTVLFTPKKVFVCLKASH